MMKKLKQIFIHLMDVQKVLPNSMFGTIPEFIN